MALDDKQRAWLDGFEAVKNKGEQAAKAREARAGAQEAIEEKIGAKREEMRAKFAAIEITAPGDGVSGAIKAALGMAEKRHLLDPSGDPAAELDMYHHAELLSSGLTSEQGAELQKVMTDLYALGRELEEMTYGDPPQKVYDDPSKIAEDLWMPLVREGIVPETYVADKYSEVKQTFGEAAKLYEERLQKYTEDMGNWDTFAENFEVVASCAKLGFDIGASIVDAAGAIDALEKGATTAELATNVEYQKAVTTAKTLTLVGTALAAVGTGTKKAIVSKDVVGTFDALTVVVTNSVTIAMGKDTGTAVGAIMGAVIHSYPVGKQLNDFRKTRKWDWPKFINAVGDAVGRDIATGDGASGSEFYKNVGEAVKGGFKILATGVEAVESDDEERALSLIAAKIVGASSSIAKSIVQIQKEEATNEALAAEKEKLGHELTDEEKHQVKEEISEKFELALGSLEGGESLEEIAESLETISGSVEKGVVAFDAAEAKRIKEASEVAQAQAMKEYMETSDDVFQGMLASGFGLEAYGEADAPAEDDTSQEALAARAQIEERRLKSLESIIAIQKKHEATYELGKTIATTAAKVGKEALSTAIPCLGLASVATQMIYAFMEAAKQGREFLIWQSNVADASAAHTVQLEAILNRHGLANRKRIETGIAAALAAVKLVGEVMKMMGHAAPIGYAVSTAATSAAALAEIASKGITKAQMSSAWSTYKEALAKPQDRYLARKALRDNPTLAKYAMAYGAVEEGNPIAKEVMRRCGLNETTLMDPGTNVKKVVEFLELRFKDDPILLKASPSPKAWYPGDIELRAASWTRFIFAAQDPEPNDSKKLADPLLGPCDATGVAGALQAFEEKSAAVSSANDGDLAARALIYAQAIAAAERLEAGFARFKPTEKENTAKIHSQVAEYATAMLARCMAQKDIWEEEKKSVDAEMSALAAQAEFDAEVADVSAADDEE